MSVTPASASTESWGTASLVPSWAWTCRAGALVDVSQLHGGSAGRRNGPSMLEHHQVLLGGQLATLLPLLLVHPKDLIATFEPHGLS